MRNNIFHWSIIKELCNEYLLFLSVVYSVNSILMIFQFKFVEYFSFHFLIHFDRLQRKIWMNWYRHGNFVNLKCTMQKTGVSHALSGTNISIIHRQHLFNLRVLSEQKRIQFWLRQFIVIFCWERSIDNYPQLSKHVMNLCWIDFQRISKILEFEYAHKDVLKSLYHFGSKK